MTKTGCSPRFITMVREFHDCMQARVQNDGEYSEPFPVINGVKLSWLFYGNVQHDVFCNAHR